LRWGAFAAALLVGARLAAADPVDPIAAVERTAGLCKSGQLEAAAHELRGLLATFEADLGPGHAAPQIVRVNLAELERLLGDEEAAKKIGRLPPENPAAPKIDPKLKRALRGLAVCATAKPAGTAKPPPSGLPAMPEITPEEHLKLAYKLVAQGQYRRALGTAKVAQKAAGSSPPPPLRMQIREALAVIRLQLGDRRGALEDAAAAGEIARATGAIGVRIRVARVVAQAGDLERAGTILGEIEASGASQESRAELDEARGDLALRLGSPHGALEHLDRALEARRKVYGPNHRHTASVHQLRGDAYRLA